MGAPEHGGADRAGLGGEADELTGIEAGPTDQGTAPTGTVCTR
jgi:hypothetical protein